MSNKEAALADIAKNSLNCIENVVAEAESARAFPRRSDASAFASINTLNSPKQVSSLTSATTSRLSMIGGLGS